MIQNSRIFTTAQSQRRFSWGDLVVLLCLAVLLYAGVRLAIDTPPVLEGPQISLDVRFLPRYAVLSTGRMLAAYILSMLFTLVYGYLAAYNRRAESFLLPTLDILQSVPILSFLPVVLLSLSAIFPQNLAAELASIVLIFTSQVWNLTFAWYQSLTTIPKELREASSIFKLNKWLRLKTLELPFAAISLIWNSMMSWAGGWFFLMAAEIFTVGQQDFRLPGIGSYLHEAADQGNTQAILAGITVLILVIVILDQLVWRPLLAWADHLKIEMVESELPPTSWFYDALRNSTLIDWIEKTIFHPIGEKIDQWLINRFPATETSQNETAARSWQWIALGIPFGAGLAYGVFRTMQMLLEVPLSQWQEIGVGIIATLLRVALALLIALAWTLPAGVLIGTNQRLAAWLQPLVQVVASVPATALFPVIVLALVYFPGGINLAAIFLMLMGTQWYLLFNIIAGASSIPQDLKYTATLLQLNQRERWRTLILPALFPYLVTGAITASGGSWNASIVAEYVHFGGQTLQTTGIGAIIARATATGDYPLLLAATLSMILAVVVLNRAVWRRLYKLAESKYRME